MQLILSTALPLKPFIGQLFFVASLMVGWGCYRLYRSLEDYDVVRGIFGGKVGTKSITCSALQAEANTDFAEAVKLYNEVGGSSGAGTKSHLDCNCNLCFLSDRL